MTTHEIVRGVFSSILEVTPDAVGDEDDFFDDLGGDSLDMMEIVLRLEDAFRIKINDGDIENITTLNETVALVDGILEKA